MKFRQALFSLLALMAYVGAAHAQTHIVATPRMLSARGKNWICNFRYPELRIPGSLMGETANMRQLSAQLRQQAQRTVDAFKIEAAAWRAPAGPIHLKSSLNVTYTLLSTGNLVSVEFDEVKYLSGAAHPTTAAVTANFRQDATPLMLADLFTEGSDWLSAVSRKVQDGVNEQAKFRHFDITDPNGYSAQVKNFTAWGITRQGLVIFLQRNQVAAGYVGLLSVNIPWKDLKSLLRPDIH